MPMSSSVGMPSSGALGEVVQRIDDGGRRRVDDDHLAQPAQQGQHAESDGERLGAEADDDEGVDEADDDTDDDGDPRDEPGVEPGGDELVEDDGRESHHRADGQVDDTGQQRERCHDRDDQRDRDADSDDLDVGGRQERRSGPDQSDEDRRTPA